MEQSLGLGKPHSQYVVSDVLGIETLATSSSKCKHNLSDRLVGNNINLRLEILPGYVKNTGFNTSAKFSQ